MNEYRVDVAVLGGGPAGIAAAVAAARNGARTLLAERYGFLGGMSTLALVYPWMTFHTAAGEQVIRGIAQEIVDRLMRRNASPGHLRDTIGFVHTLTPYHPEAFKVLAFDMLQEAGAELLLHAWAVDADCVGGELRSVTLQTKSGPVRVRARMFVDATGDGDIAAFAGAPWEQGNANGKTQPMTMKFRMRGVDFSEIKAYMRRHPEDFYRKSLISELDRLPLTGVAGFYSKWREAALPIPRDGVLLFAGPGEDEAVVNVSRVSGLNPMDARDLTSAEIEGRRQVEMIESFLRQSIPGFGRARVTQVGTQIGVRETRRIAGKYVLTGEDVLTGRRFPDAVARSGYPIDIHQPEGKGVTEGFIEAGGAYDIPYRCLLPQGVFNLVMAGRCLSASHEAQATARLTPSCMALGQAAGTAAALAAADGRSAEDVPIELLQERLLRGGAELGLDHDITPEPREGAS
ncbi:FAD-dependent oxidoreductase [Paenibacillus thermoaerophilus]|uniref:FAD-dependent oxidoreductase n=1 Tax=Paenibacillus thermoaerophilus TaxID=1215385 RepID=A0ABW2V265_9BACL|nr:FAD-dependent oxidoreductase [Paenibacillus thermoaerophilus]TMV11155.1 FAD-dependent oxidoreductase [Paenibacillus thermoaerophilus]